MSRRVTPSANPTYGLLIEMKKITNRPRDLDDIEHLEIILNEERRS